MTTCTRVGVLIDEVIEAVAAAERTIGRGTSVVLNHRNLERDLALCLDSTGAWSVARPITCHRPNDPITSDLASILRWVAITNTKIDEHDIEAYVRQHDDDLLQLLHADLLEARTRITRGAEALASLRSVQ